MSARLSALLAGAIALTSHFPADEWYRRRSACGASWSGEAGGPFPHNLTQKTAQIFKPPYLFDSQNNEIQPPVRPVIDDAPGEIHYGASFTIETEQSADIVKVSLIRLGAATHSYDMDQRFLFLDHTGVPEGLITIAAPAHAYMAPPGYYMLFILKNGDRAGVMFPSVAKIVKLSPAP